MVPALSIANTANAKVTYEIGDRQYDSGWKDSTAAAVVNAEEELPKASLSKSVLKLEVVGASRVPVSPQPSPVTAQPGDWVRYTLTLANTSSLPLTNPVIVDKLPAMLLVDMADVSFSTDSSGLTAGDTGSYTDGSGTVYVVKNLSGALEPGKTATLTIEGMVRYSAAASDPVSIENVAYAASLDRIEKNVLNPYGTPFTDVSGAWPALVLDGALLGGEEGQSYQALSATATVNLVQSSEISIYKMVAADVTGFGSYASNDEYAIASVKDGTGDKGKIVYQIVIVNGGSSAVKNVRLVDKLPVIGDTDLKNSPRLTRWPVTFGGIASAVDETGASVHYSLYSTTGKSNAEYLSAIQYGPTGWSGGAGSDAAAFVMDFSKTSGGTDYSLKAGGKIIITYTASAPSADLGAETLDGYYFEASVNNATAAVDTYSVVTSATAKVVLMPEAVGVGNRVWIDKNANGIQDGDELDDPSSLTGEPSYTGGGITLSLMRYFNSDSYASTVGSTGLGANGFYRFDGLTPAALKKTVYESAAYDGEGNILTANLRGSGRAAYQIKVSGIPAGYFITAPFAQNGGIAPNYAAGSGRAADNNFKKSGEAYLSERFYLPPGGDNLTVDLGLVRVRDLEIHKLGSDSRTLSGVGFTIYGPYTDAQLDAGVLLDGTHRIASIATDAFGKAGFASTPDLFLNYYANYVVVESVPAPHYDASRLTVSGGSPAAATHYTVTGDGIDGGNYFVLPAKTGEEALKDSVVVTNPYTASGSITISGQKEMTGRELAEGDFTFLLTDAADTEHPVSAGNDALGAFSFDITYDLDDIGVHRYTVSEVDEGLANHTYDDRVYTVVVTVTDSGLNDGLLNVRKEITLAGEPSESIGFSNRYAATVSVPLSGRKVLTGRTLEAGEFAFKLFRIAGQAEPQLLQTAVNAANGSFAFQPLVYSQEELGNTYTYIVKEDPAAGMYGSLPGHTYDATEYEVRITVGYDAETGELTALVKTDIAGQPTEADEPLAFANSYEADTSVTLSGTKALSGRTIADGQFSFRLTDVTGGASTSLETVRNTGATFEFSPLSYSQNDIGKTYAYEVRELNAGVGGYTYDSAVYTVRVAVGYDRSTGRLTTAVTPLKDGEPTQEVAFRNAYHATGAYAPTGTKTLTGRALADGMFRFAVKNAEGVTVATGLSDASGMIAFTEISYQKNAERDDTGEHQYTITEVTGNDRGIDDTGILYSSQSYRLNVTVVDSGDGTLRTEVTYPDGTPAFVNGTETTDVTGRKLWADQANLFGKRPAEVTVYLLADGTVVDSKTIGGSGDAWDFSFTNLPRYRYDDPRHVVEIGYTVDESGVPGYHKSVGAVSLSTGVNGRQIIGYDITNAIRQFSVTKRTSGGARLAGATLALYSVQGGIRTLVETWRTTAATDHVISGLEPGDYVLSETVVPDGYVRAADIAIIIAEDGTVTSGAMSAPGVVRMIDEPIPTASVSGTKTWVDMGDEGGLRPDSISITLYADGVRVNAQPTWRYNGDVWTYTYTGLKVYRSGNSGARVIYTVQETPVTGYEAQYDGLNIVNQLVDIEVRYIEILGQKTWVDDNNAAGVRPDSITVNLLRNGEVIQSKVVTAEDGWAYAFANLPTSDGRSTVYAYAINEKAVPGYARSVRDYNLTNTYVPPKDEEPAITPKKPSYTPENWEELITLLDTDVPLYGGLLKTGDETPLYPFVFGGLGLIALILALFTGRRRKKNQAK